MQNRLIRLGLSAKEPMILVDKRLDKATAPHLLWVDAVDKVGDEVANALICVFVDGLVAAPVGGATRSFSRLMANTTNAVR